MKNKHFEDQADQLKIKTSENVLVWNPNKDSLLHDGH